MLAWCSVRFTLHERRFTNMKPQINADERRCDFVIPAKAGIHKRKRSFRPMRIVNSRRK